MLFRSVRVILFASFAVYSKVFIQAFSMSAKQGCKQFFTPETKLTEFDIKVYDACMRIPKGKVSTYKAMAEEIGSPRAYRAVGSSLKRNPFAPRVPCHRVVASDFALGGFQGSTDMCGGNLKRKVEMLEEEGVTIDNHNKNANTVANVKVSKKCFHDFK